MHFFGSMGTLSFFIGFLVLLYLTMSKYFLNVPGIADRPLFYFGILTVIIGAQLFLTGFLAELISRNSHNRNQYHINETLGLSDDDFEVSSGAKD